MKIVVGKAKPFIKWAGSKRSLLKQIQTFFPKQLLEGQIEHYHEPFLGSGAMFFHLAEHNLIRSAKLSDSNSDLILTYKVVQKNVDFLIELLLAFQAEYDHLPVPEKEIYFKKVRETFNQEGIDFNYETPSYAWSRRASQFIFLNKTCYGGMFRVNSKGFYNVPFGKQKKPQIFDPKLLRTLSGLLQIATLEQADFQNVEKRLEEQSSENTFIYFDPPYRPLSATANFTSYQLSGFNDDDQETLGSLYRKLHERGAKLMLSNSDPKSENPEDNFFEDLYQGFSIYRVGALRRINSDFSKRGLKNELLITNYEVKDLDVQ